uniref:PDZ domain-containing protein n=1 Tax=Timema monikensis TaxID=170555 RepID=A0A7R9E994_9NEOP|nr:unnamed protein product [Timema monikensis]
MASPEGGSPALEIRHKSQQSHDSGAYIDWNSEDSGGSPTLSAEPGNVKGEFVTVVAVESGNLMQEEITERLQDASQISDTPFVTVLSIGDDAGAKAREYMDETKIVSVNVSSPVAVVENVELTRPSVIKIQSDDSWQEIIEEVLVYRLPGERLGFGLKFEGGTKTAEKVRRLFIQSCADDSPASRAKCSWGCLKEGDEVLEIDGAPVRSMTRIDCVRCLKESNVVIKLFVRHPAFNELNLNRKLSSSESIESDSSDRSPTSPLKSSGSLPLVISAEMKKTIPPPPIPPRKIPRKAPSVPLKSRPAVPPPAPSIVDPPTGFDDSDYVNGELIDFTVQSSPTFDTRSLNLQEGDCRNFESRTPTMSTPKLQRRLSPSSPKSPLRLSLSNSPESTRSLGRRSSGFSVSSIPPEAEVYLDLLALEEMNRLNGESESDDTGSSISTVVDRLSSVASNSSFSDLRSSASSTCDTTTPSTPTTSCTSTIDLAKVLGPFEQLEREFSSTGNDLVFGQFINSEDNLNEELDETVSTSSDHVTIISRNLTSLVEVDALALQPPLNFQDAPLGIVTEQEFSAFKMNEVTDEVVNSENKVAQDLISKLTLITDSRNKVGTPNSKNVLLNTLDGDTEITTKSNHGDTNHKSKSPDEHSCLGSTSQFPTIITNVNVKEANTEISDIPMLPPKPVPRKDVSISKFRSGKKRPPPPPPPRNDRPQALKPEEVSLIDIKKQGYIQLEDNAKPNDATLVDIEKLHNTCKEDITKIVETRTEITKSVETSTLEITKIREEPVVVKNKSNVNQWKERNLNELSETKVIPSKEFEILTLPRDVKIIANGQNQLDENMTGKKEGQKSVDELSNAHKDSITKPLVEADKENTLELQNEIPEEHFVEIDLNKEPKILIGNEPAPNEVLVSIESKSALISEELDRKLLFSEPKVALISNLEDEQERGACFEEDGDLVMKVLEVPVEDNASAGAANSLEMFEARILEDYDDEDLLPPGFEDCDIMSPSEAFFPFRWGMTSHLATIGEDEAEEDEDLRETRLALDVRGFVLSLTTEDGRGDRGSNLGRVTWWSRGTVSDFYAGGWVRSSVPTQIYLISKPFLHL